MKNFIVSIVGLVVFLVASHASALTCARSCGDQCKKGWLGGVDPVCFSACQTWQLAKCWDLSDPYVSVWGEAGSKAYPAAAETMKLRFNGNMRRLKNPEKDILRTHFGGLVDDVIIYENAGLMGEWGGGATKITFFDAIGQTYGTRIYLDPDAGKLNRVELVTLIGHEMCHTAQYRSRGSSLSKFGRDYFEGFAKRGSYEKHPMETECNAIEEKIRVEAQKQFAFVDARTRSWDMEVCNRSGFDEVYVAHAYHHHLPQGGFSLIENPYASGWTGVTKGACKTIATVPPGVPLNIAAQAGPGGNFQAWNAKQGPLFCIDTSQNFVLEGTKQKDCAGKNEEKIRFYTYTTPWENGVGKHTMNIGGGHTQLKLCNQTPRILESAMLRFERQAWHGVGWFVFNPGQCHVFSFGSYHGKVWTFFREQSNYHVKWGTPGAPEFCAFTKERFYHRQGDPCKGTNAEVVRGIEHNLSQGLATYNVIPH